MKSQEIIETLKTNYTRDLRRQVVKSILRCEKDKDDKGLESSYKLMNQIFTYVISELNWTIANSTSQWDNTPLKIISETFPKIESSQWYKDQQIDIKDPTK